ncbi:YigZ family protein [Nocardioides sp. CFH 31398]|uniref:IMPACT family protein n=1 Tax=Nocardioides sp. CFH 31398 TaxID=2919579 RepID=UPI001F05EB9B|nr:YigZ family protein [Nocardioides sp. CFH 31398]MCH1868172.1 YigZ family protein [Nocardioides sp. CFH 31398]
MSADAYLVPARASTAETEVTRSRFLATVERVGDEDAARAVVEGLRRAHHDARHHCSAWVLGPDRAIERSHDDGEPAGTAGAPILEVVRGSGLSDVVVVVTRWFGGTLLGAGGLVRAYGDAARAGLDAAGSRRRLRLTELTLTLPHADAGRVEASLRDAGVAVLDVAWAEAVTLRLGVRPDAVHDLHARVATLTGGSASADPAGSSWVDAPATAG